MNRNHSRREDPTGGVKLLEIGDLQLRVLSVLWKYGQGSVHDVLNHIEGEPKPAYTSVLTVLRNLEKRGLVDHRARGRLHVFRPLVTEEQLKRGVLRQLVRRLFRGSAQDLVFNLVADDQVSDDELQVLKQRIAEEEDSRDDQPAFMG